MNRSRQAVRECAGHPQIISVTDPGLGESWIASASGLTEASLEEDNIILVSQIISVSSFASVVSCLVWIEITSYTESQDNKMESVEIAENKADTEGLHVSALRLRL